MCSSWETCSIATSTGSGSRLPVCARSWEVEWVLVQGNHDMIPDLLLQESGIQQIGRLDEGPFTFTHDPADMEVDFGYHVCGHVHPGHPNGWRGTTAVAVAVLLFSGKQAIMPAFGAFTGMHAITPAMSDRVYAITGEAVIEVGP